MTSYRSHQLSMDIQQYTDDRNKKKSPPVKEGFLKDPLVENTDD